MTRARHDSVVITGIGTHGAGGSSAAALWESTLQQTIQVEERTISSGRRCTVYSAPDPDIDISEAKLVKHADRSARLALAAAKQAWQDACLTTSPAEPQRVGVIIGSSRGPAATASNFEHQKTHPSDAVYTAFSSIAGVVAAGLGAARCAQMASATCVSGAVALQSALFLLRSGELDVAIVGGVDAPLVDNLLEQFSVAGVLGSALRPFDKTRNGTVVGEGAAFVIAETEAHAKQRAARVRGVIHAVAIGCEPHLRTSMSMNARGLQDTARRALSSCALATSQINLAILHGTGTRLNDLMESRCMRDLFGETNQQPYSLATKAITGHTLGASSIFQLLIGLESARNQFIPATANCSALDPECPIRLSLGASNEVRYGLCLTSGFWGNSSCIIFERAS